MASDAPVKRRPEATGTHRPEGVFVASGPAIRRNATVGELSILDVAPLLLYTLDLPPLEQLDGRLPEEILSHAVSPSPPARAAASAAARSTEEAAEPVLDAEAEAEILKRLQALGYVE
jgi:hypothetical protein